MKKDIGEILARIDTLKPVPQVANKVMAVSRDPQSSMGMLSEIIQYDQALTAFYLGYAHTQAQNWNQALPHLNRALSLSPDSHAFINLRGVAHFKLGDYGRAADDFHSALGLDSGSAVDLANLGLCYKAMNRPDMAIHYLQAGLELDSDLEFARDHLQKLLQEAR